MNPRALKPDDQSLLENQTVIKSQDGIRPSHSNILAIGQLPSSDTYEHFVRVAGIYFTKIEADSREAQKESAMLQKLGDLLQKYCGFLTTNGLRRFCVPAKNLRVGAFKITTLIALLLRTECAPLEGYDGNHGLANPLKYFQKNNSF